MRNFLSFDSRIFEFVIVNKSTPSWNPLPRGLEYELGQTRAEGAVNHKTVWILLFFLLLLLV